MAFWDTVDPQSAVSSFHPIAGLQAHVATRGQHGNNVSLDFVFSLNALRNFKQHFCCITPI